MIVERVIEVRITRADPPRAERWISVTRAGESVRPAKAATEPAPIPEEVPLQHVAPPPPALRAPAPPAREEAAVTKQRVEERRPRTAVPEEPAKARISYKDITPEQEIELIRRYQAGDCRAGGVLLQAHERLIYETSRRYFGRGLDTEDVLQAARMGFLKGIQRFDTSRGVKLTTYANWWVRQAARRELRSTGSTIRLPEHVHDKLQKAAKSREPISDKLAAIKVLQHTSSLDAPVDGDDGDPLVSFIASADPDSSPVDERTTARQQELLEKAMEHLAPNEREIIQRRFADESETLKQIGNSFDLSRERIRQIEAKAMKKIKAALLSLMTKDDAATYGRVQ